MVTSLPDDAAQVLRAARVTLALRYPYLSTATLRLPFRNARGAAWCPTMATDGYHIWYHEQWVLTLTREELSSVIAHEVLHVVFGHADRRGERAPRRWNIAADLAINALLSAEGHPLPSGALLDPQFWGLAAEQIYDRLPKHSATLNTYHPSGPGRSPQYDDLLDPDQTAMGAHRDADAPDREQRRHLRRILAEDMQGKLHGTSAAYFQHEVKPALNAPLDWPRVLRQWLTDRVHDDWRPYPFAKRYIHRGLYLPSVGVESPRELLFAIDTSASMPDEAMERAFTEIIALRDMFPCRLTVVQCDAAIQSIDEFGVQDLAALPRVLSVRGRGGTDFRPVFDWLRREREGGPGAVLIFLTDGFGSFPTTPPESPCIWLVIPAGAPSERFPFGVVLPVSG
jgi:predicted metal-dependent peptidase